MVMFLFARVEVLQAIHFELEGLANEAVLIGAGVVPERDVRMLEFQGYLWFGSR